MPPASQKMKLHLPSALRKALLAVSVVSMTVASTVQAAIMHPSVSLQTYTDFGSNMGRYTIYQQNELLQHLNSKGVFISYTQGQENYRLQHGMISYESMVDGGPFTAISYNATATVQHNGVTNPVFTGRFIGSDQAIHYAGIEYRSCENNTFLLTPQIDYKVTRISKVITDITPSALYDARAHKLAGEDINDMLQYRAGGGYMQQADETGKTTWLAGAYAYVVGGIVDNWSFGYSSGYDYETNTPAIRDGRGMPDDSYTLSIKGVIDFTRETAGTASHPLPFVTQGGDSGSPVWVWDTYSESYQLISCHQARGSYDSYSRGASEWTKETLKSFCVDVDMDQADHKVHIGEIREVSGKSKTYEALANGSTHASTTTKIGSVLSENDQVIKDFIGIEHGKNTWLNLNDLKDGQKKDAKGNNVNWYAYGNEYLNATNTEADGLQYADLFMTQNLVFISSGEEVNRIVLDADVDLGIGYAQFSKTTDSNKAGYTISSHDDANDRDYNFNHAGFIIDKDVDVHLQIANTQKDTDGTDYYREWRKTGEGNLYLEGTGNNNIFLNVGGKGTTYLREQGNGYAAYNVLINNGATVNIGGDISQIKRDVTFGYGGGYLDFYGAESMEWYKTAAGEPTREGFTISALTQDAIITNTTGSTTLTYKEGGNTKFLGSFQDGDGSGTLKVVYDGGKGSTWTLNSIHTKLNGQSGLEVKTGSVVLVGTNTEHAQGSLTGYNQLRYSNEDDWHYADAKMNVTVDSGATFELGSHARLTGNVTVQDKGTFLMREGVRHEMEYIEGWYELENTCTEEIRKYYGLHGDVILNEGGIMQVKFSEKTDANTTLTGAISGAGSMTVDTAKGSLTLAGDNSNFTGTKTISNGILILDHLNAAGNYETNKWNIGKSAWMTVNGTSAADALKTVDTSSEGVLALSQDEEDAPLNLQGYHSLIIGAKKGEVIQFGKKEGEDREYAAVDGKWNLGGGGGELVVNYALRDGRDLILGNAYTEGKVTLTNTQNEIANILFSGKVTLDYDSIAALGDASVHLDYTNRIVGKDTDGDKTINLIDETSSGVMLLDKMAGVGNIDLTKHGELYLGVSEDTIYSGDFTLADSGSYHFGGCTATLTLTKALTDQGEGGSSALYIDAEGYTGGVVELQKALGITGYVYVMGWDFFREDSAGGEITLKVNEANSFSSTAGIMLFGGGTLDINGYEQTLKAVYATADSRIIDSSEEKSGTLYIASDFSSLDGIIDVGTLLIEAGGENHVYLGGETIYRDCTIKSGQVILSSPKSLCATGRTVLEKDATLTISNGTVTANLELQNSTVTLGDTEMSVNPTGNLGGTLTVKDGTTGTVNFAINGSSLSAVVSTGETGTLKLTGNRGIVSSPLVNVDGSEEDVAGGQASGGTVVVELNELRLQSGSSIAIGGTLNLVGQENQTSHKNQLILSSGGGANNMERNISHMNVEKGLALTIQEENWNTIWNIHKLTGEGNITWNSTTTHWYSARMILDGENDFTGTLRAERNSVTTNGRKYAAYLELAHDKAAQSMDIHVTGTGSNDNMGLAINTENAVVASLAGNAYSALYAGVAVEGAGNDKASVEIFKNAPTSTRKACITVKTAETADFAGNVYGAAQGDMANGFGLDLVMAGEGTQKFSGSTVQFNNVTVQSGILELSSTGLELADRATIHRGATLTMTDSLFDLKEGTTLMVTGTNSPQANLNANLKLSGGVLGFNGESLFDDKTGYALSTFGLDAESQQSLKVLFEATYALHEGEYMLASGGQWASIADSEYSAIGLDYYKAEFKADAGGLSVTLSLMDNSAIWKGNSDHSTWSNTDFGTDPALTHTDCTVVFNNMAESKTVQVEGEQTADKLLFDSTEEYTVKAAEGSSLQAEGLRQTGSGTTTLGSGVNITGLAEIKAGTLVLDSGARFGSASVEEGAELKLAAVPSSTPESITGDGRLVVDWNGATGELGSTDIGQIEVRRGTLTVNSQPLGVGDSILVAKEGTLHATRTDFLNEKSKGLPIQLAGTLQLEIDTARDFTYAVTSPYDEEGVAQKGYIVKSGTGTMTLKSSVSADTVTVSQGNLQVREDIAVISLLEGVDNVKVVSGASATIGRNEFTVEGEEFKTNFSVEGSNSSLELSLAKSAAKTIKGDISVTNGATLRKFDGGLVLAGTTQLGKDASDSVNLATSWGKSGWLFSGEVKGSGTVNLSSSFGDVKELYTFSNDENTFDGTFVVNGKSRLVAGANNALANADVNIKDDGGLLVAADNANIRNLSGTAGSIVQLAQGHDSSVLIIKQTEARDYAGSIGGGLSLTKTGNASLRLCGDNSEFSGRLTLQEGTLILNAAQFGSSSEGFNMTLSGGTLKLEGGSLNLRSGDLAITETTTLDVESLEHFSYSSYQDGEFDKENGYAAGNLVLISAASISDDAISHLTRRGALADKTLLVEDNNIVVQGTAPSTSDYHVNTNVSYGQGENNTAYEQAKSIVLRLADAKLELNSNLNQAVCSGGIVAQSKGATVNIGQDVTLNAASLHDDNTVYLDGKGTYQLEVKTNSQNIDTTLGNANRVELAEGWAGTVQLQGAGGSTSHLMLEKYGHNGSSVMLAGTSGWLGNGAVITADLLLEGENGADALTISNGSSNGKEYFQGAISGSGSINRTWSGGKLTFHFSGVLSQWTGSIKTTNGSLDLYFYGDAKDMGAAITTTAGKTTAIYVGEDETHPADVTFQKEITATSLNLLGASSAKLNATTSLDSISGTKGTLSIQAETNVTSTVALAGLKLGEERVLKVGNDQSGLTISAQKGEASINAAIALDAAKNSHSITGADGARIENAIIDLAAGTRLEMANVTLGANSCITDDTAVLVANGLVLDADIRANLKPLTYGDAIASPAEEPADMVCFTLSNIQDVLIEGKDRGLVVNMVGDSSQKLGGAEWLRLGLGEDDMKGQFSDGLNVTLLYEDATGQQHSAQGVYTLEDVEAQAAAEAAAMNHDYVYFRITANVPEPATGTLSLLALAALAARRRRK